MASASGLGAPRAAVAVPHGPPCG